MITTRTILFLVIASMWAGLHMLSLWFSLYWFLPWIDIPMHFVGGFVVALGMCALSDLSLPTGWAVASLWRSVVFVACVAVLWELFEWQFGLTSEIGYVVDTTFDIIFGICGGVVGYWFAHKMEEVY